MKVILLMFIFLASEVYAQRNRPSSGRTSSRSGTSSSSSGSSSSTVSSGSYSSSSSSSSSSSGGSSDYSGGGSYGGSSYYSPEEYTDRARQRLRGRNTAPILKKRFQEKRLVRSGSIGGMRDYHNGYYRRRSHVVYSGGGCFSSVNYSSIYMYQSTLSSAYYYNSWVMEPTLFYYSPGFHCVNGYPYYIDSGYQHRYSEIDLCNYELVDLDDKTVVKTYHSQSCKVGFDSCAAKRDQLNSTKYAHRYACLEKADDAISIVKTNKIPSLINGLSESEIAETKLFLEMNDDKTLYNMASDEGIRRCKIVKAKKNQHKCNYLVTVGDKIYPLGNGTVCSNSKKTKISSYGCNFSSQRKNAVCLLSLAIAEGYCSKSAEILSKYY